MKRRTRTSAAGIELIKDFEGFRPQAVRLSSGRHLIGYGHMDSAREGLEITEGDAQLLLQEYDLRPVEELLSESVLTPLEQNEFDALASFVFNIGVEGFRGSDVLSFLNSGQKTAAAGAMSWWRKARVDGKLIVVDALVRRRSAEMALFLDHPAGRVPAPSALIRPRLDMDSSQTQAAQNGALEEDEPKVEVDIASVSFEDAAGPVIIEETQAPKDGNDQPALLATEEAAEDVKKRLSRILDETPKGVVGTRIEEDRDGPSIEEITAAVSALAEPSDAPAPEPRKPDLPRPQRQRKATDAKTVARPVSKTNGRVDADDLDGAETVMRQIETELSSGRTPAGVKVEGFDETSGPKKWAWPVATGIGILLMLWGMADRFALLPIDQTMTGTDYDPVPPLLVLAGLILIGLGIWNMISGSLRDD